MSWLWSSSSSTSRSTLAPSESNPPVQPRSGNATSGPSQKAPSKPESREEQADREIESFLASLGATTTTEAAPAQAPAQPTTHTQISSSHTSPVKFEPTPTEVAAPDDSPDKPLDISPDALYPRTMSCRQAFDQAFYCQSLGGKFNDIYRYGALQSCSENWDAFWFCMRVRTLGEKEREKQISDFYRERDVKKKAAKGSSEDVWELRTVPVEKAFWRDPDEGLVGGVLQEVKRRREG